MRLMDRKAKKKTDTSSEHTATVSHIYPSYWSQWGSRWQQFFQELKRWRFHYRLHKSSVRLEELFFCYLKDLSAHNFWESLKWTAVSRFICLTLQIIVMKQYQTHYLSQEYLISDGLRLLGRRRRHFISERGSWWQTASVVLCHEVTKLMKYISHVLNCQLTNGCAL